ncbi:MAG: ATP-dependent Clp protease ATP-binding subunit [Corallococcus sp.]|nr:ATP-dependent Clp protease ATP-binding subunit [Corallococcus sp.]MCM1359860.1 ATP-dependent Clp protease ATP-binding subunit [Corallococcus sp.]MCM1395294.1 ATP-dependent Clp protease ATP-binding subunit [Corallococcus sp.]
MQSEKLQKVFENAYMFANQLRVSNLKAEHILFELANVDSEAKDILAEFGLTKKNLEPKQTGLGGPISNSTEIQELNSRATYFAEQLCEKDVSCVHALLAILTMKDSYAYGKIEYLLEQQGYTTQQLYERIVQSIPNKDKLREFVRDPQIDEHRNNYYSNTDTLELGAEKTYKSQSEFGLDLTEKALAGGFDPVIGRDAETSRVIQTLTRRTKNNPVLVGEAGVGKTAVVEGLALKIAQGHVPAELQGKHIVELDLAGMVAGTRYRGDFEERLKDTVQKVINAGNIILFIDEIHNIVGAGGSGERAMDAAEILKPALARGQLQIVGATTTAEYTRYIESDPALERRFQPITVAEPSKEMAIQIVNGVKSKYETHHGVEITDEAIKAAVQLSVRYITDRFLPDKALDVIDEACSRLKINAFAVPERLVELTTQLNTLKRKKDLAIAVGDSAQVEKLNKQYNDLYFEYEYEQSDYERELAEYRCKLTAEDVRFVISQMTGVPVAQISREERDKLVNLEKELQKRVIGQQQAVSVVSLAVRRQRAGLKDPNRPIGSFIFVGPTGVGKTELTKALAECLFGDDSEVIRMDMSEYMDKQSTAKLIGAPPGYVGYEERGYLTEQVRKKPYSVVLFDEIEKAHPDVFNLLLQILDEGRLTDSHGKTVDFRNTVIIMTSNIGVANEQAQKIGFGPTDNYAQMRDDVEHALKNFFRPEFLNRVDEVVVFNYLGQNETFKITELLCFNLYKRLKGTVNLKFTDNALKQIAAEGFDKNYGARPLKRTIQRRVEDVLAEKLLTGEINRGETVIVDAVHGEILIRKKVLQNA